MPVCLPSASESNWIRIRSVSTLTAISEINYLWNPSFRNKNSWNFLIFAIMRLVASILAVCLCFLNTEQAFGQSKAETVEWINSQGEEILKQITGNSYIHWELDEYGSFRITNYNPETNKSGKKNIEKQYTYLNLYELDSQKTGIKKNYAERVDRVLLISCRKEKGDCIKRRLDFEDSSLKTRATSVFSFILTKDLNSEEEKKLEKYLKHAIRFFRDRLAN